MKPTDKKWPHRVIFAVFAVIMIWGFVGLAFGPDRYTASGENAHPSDAYGRY